MNGIEARVGDRVEIMRLDLIGGVGRQAAREYEVRMVPATLIFDGRGELIERKTGMPHANKVIEVFADIT